MKQEIDIELFRQKLEANKLSILREFGEQLGMSNPTALKKKELIDQMIEIVSGKLEPIKSPKGRPSIQSGYSSDVKLILNECVKKHDFKVRDVVEKTQEYEVAEQKTVETREGVLEIQEDGYAFLRVQNCSQCENDAYLSASQIRRFMLRTGDYLKGLVKRNYEDKFAAMFQILEINGIKSEKFGFRKQFENLIPVYPDKKLTLESPKTSSDLAIRCLDIVAPIGLGQRGMIVSPPKSGKTTLLKKLANSISANHPDVKLIMLLIDERPEEVTDIKRSVDAEVIYSTFDEMPQNHIQISELALEYAKRQVEVGKDVVILLDSITRLARAYNLSITVSGRTLSGGLDTNALLSPKKFFGAARNVDGGGSLTIIATALVDTGSKMDDIIFEEFKGTGNMEIHLDRNLSEKRIFPAIDLYKSGTRKDELLFSSEELECNFSVRKLLATMDKLSAMETLLNGMLRTKNNREFYAYIKKMI